MEHLLYLSAPLIAILTDKMYYGSAKNIIFGFFPVKRKYLHNEFMNYRLVGIVTSSFAITYAGINKNITIGMAGAAIFLISHFIIYFDIYLCEKRKK